jgi:hypothetical protein
MEEPVAAVAKSPGKGRARLQFVVGFAVAVIALVAIGEVALRVAPPRAIKPYLADDDTPGPFRSDPVYGVQYRSWDSFREDYATELKPHEKLFSTPNPPRTWAMFGSSFVHADGMIADTTRKHVSNRHVFNLGRNEFLYVRAAQIDLLLEHGLRPERILFALMPLDVSVLARHTFAQVHAGAGGALAYDPRLPAMGGSIIENSRLAMAGWVRADMQHAIPFFKPAEMTKRMDQRVLIEVRYLFERIADVTKRHRVPVTVLLIPNWEQITKGEAYAFQDALKPIALETGFDVLDVRDVFRNYPDKAALFLPDKHFTDIGNRILLDEFVKHLHALGEATDVKLPEGFPG